MPDHPRSLVPPPRRPESFRLLGLLFGMAMLALVARWLQPEFPDPGRERVSLNEALGAVAGADAGADAPLQLADADAGKRPDSAADSHGWGLQPIAPRPISATLCHALDEKLKALHAKAAGDLTRRELTAVRTERNRVSELQSGLRCRPGNVRYWF